MEIYALNQQRIFFIIIGTVADSYFFYNPSKAIQIVIMPLFLEIISHAN